MQMDVVKTINDTYSALEGQFVLTLKEGRLQKKKTKKCCLVLLRFGRCASESNAALRTILCNAQVGAHVKTAHFVDGNRF